MEDEQTTSTESSASSGGGIKTAAEVIEKVLAKEAPAVVAEPTAKPESKAKPAPARRVEKLEAATKPDAAAVAEPESDASLVEKARYHLKHGNVAEALNVFGDLKALSEGMPDAVREALARKLGVSSAQWERVRKFEAGAKRAVAAREQELNGVIQRLQDEYAPLHQARALYKSGDFDAAFKAAFGEDAADYQRKVITQRVGKNPEIEALKAQLEERDRRQAERERADATAKEEAEQARMVHMYLTETQQECAASEDLAVRKFSARPEFIQRIYAIQRANYDHESNTTLPLAHAAEMARDEILNSLKQWSVDDNQTGAPPANAARASALPAKPPVTKVPARALKQSQAAEGTGQPHKLDSKQVMDKYKVLLEQATD